MMVEARKDDDRKPEAEDAAADLSRFAEASAKLFAEQTAAMAVMTAYGMSVAAQMTSFMLGAMRGPAAAEGADGIRPAEATPAAETQPSAKVVPLRPRGAKVSRPSEVDVAAKPAQKVAKAVKAKASAAVAPASKPTRAAAKVADKPASEGDDLKKISGLGPRLEQELNARGIRRYADIAALSKTAVKKLDGELGLEGRVVRDDWAGQAKALSGGKG
jgi:NADH-quinone oxidoreductase subunit E